MVDDLEKKIIILELEVEKGNNQLESNSSN